MKVNKRCAACILFLFQIIAAYSKIIIDFHGGTYRVILTNIQCDIALSRFGQYHEYGVKYNPVFTSMVGQYHEYGVNITCIHLHEIQ